MASMREAIYHPKRHSAAHTTDYLFAQLIPYLGNKRKLLPLIAEAVTRTGVTEGVFADFFAGSGVVSRWAKAMGYCVIANDWEPYAQAINGCAIGLNAPPTNLPAFVFDELNALIPGDHGYLTRNYCPIDDAHPDPIHERCFYTHANGAKLDAMRQQIDVWQQEGRMTAAESVYLLAPLLYAASYVSNTSGIFKAYHHGWGGHTHTALYRILSEVRLVAPVLFDNGHTNPITQLDAQILASCWTELTGKSLDIAYLDPPYNQHPYSSNYHLLNTIALWDKPFVPPISRGTKSAIRTDWRTGRRSRFNSTQNALSALTDLVDAIPARWILTSYSTDGNIPLEALLAAMAERGATEIVPQRYKRYRVSSPRMSALSHNVEFVLILDKSKPADITAAERHQRSLIDAALP